MRHNAASLNLTRGGPLKYPPRMDCLRQPSSLPQMATHSAQGDDIMGATGRRHGTVISVKAVE
jgi:hypothetical protein